MAKSTSKIGQGAKKQTGKTAETTKTAKGKTSKKK
ncbi:hypothetical protein Pan241w_22970 [Gimesia alba]|uniref:Uncharacterized protein n=1 Tax=Gimesia alba TaxID=2527973 RepID=A0A517REC6_9PLAN|nr:hypothetical protein Pan241w_22970 [Gimesia alba]